MEGIMIRPAAGGVAVISLAICTIIVLCALWWMDHERLNLENAALRRQLQAAQLRLQELHNIRGDQK
jgi:hypothetical protein